jgi:hypothetical protein
LLLLLVLPGWGLLLLPATLLLLLLLLLLLRVATLVTGLPAALVAVPTDADTAEPSVPSVGRHPPMRPAVPHLLLLLLRRPRPRRRHGVTRLRCQRGDVHRHQRVVIELVEADVERHRGTPLDA